MSSSTDRERLQQAVSQLATQIEELKKYIEIAQNRVLAIQNEINEIRMSLEAINSLEKASFNEAILALDRRGYAFIKATIPPQKSILVTIGNDYVVALPLDKARNLLNAREKDLISMLRDAEADLKKLLDLYNQMNRKLREYLAALTQSGGAAPAKG